MCLLCIGEQFDGLEFISTLLTKKSTKKTTVPLIEVVSGDNISDDDADGDEEDGDEEDGDEWLWEQNLTTESDDDVGVELRQRCYGFNDKASGLFTSKLSEERREITDLPDPDSTTHSERRRWMAEYEAGKFDADHYLADYFDEEAEIRHLIDAGVEGSGSDARDAVGFTDEEKFTLKNLPRREILLTTSRERRVALLSVVDLLLAACYDARSTGGEATVESGWTINKLSATCCCFVRFDSVRQSCLIEKVTWSPWRMIYAVLRTASFITMT